MNVPGIAYYENTLPASDGLVFLHGACLAGAEDYGLASLAGRPVMLPVFPPHSAHDLGALGGARHFIYAESEPPDTPEGAAALTETLKNAVEEADAAGVTFLSFLPPPCDKKDSRFFAVMNVFLRALMTERDRHPSLASFRFLCRDKETAEWIARVYNFYYPATKAERMQP